MGTKNFNLPNSLIDAVKQVQKEAIEHPNSCGQGYDPTHKDCPLHDTLTKHSFTYSHSTPIHKKDGSYHTHHTYAHGEHKVGFKHGETSWESSVSSASGHRKLGIGTKELDTHLTGKAKRYGWLKEEVENIDEVSKKKLTNYLDKTEPYNDLLDPPDGTGGSRKRRISGRRMAFKKLARNSERLSNPAKVHATEEVEVVDEKYLGFKKLEGKLAGKGVSNPGAVAAAIGRKKYGAKKFDHAAEHGDKMKGMKPIKEEENLDELSKKTLGSYINKSAADMARAEGNRENAYAKSKYSDDATPEDFKRATNETRYRKRGIGIGRAVNRLTKESIKEILINKVMALRDKNDK